jgi:hypothetical protein
MVFLRSMRSSLRPCLIYGSIQPARGALSGCLHVRLRRHNIVYACARVGLTAVPPLSSVSDRSKCLITLELCANGGGRDGAKG